MREVGKGRTDCDAAVLTNLEFYEIGGKKGAEATVDLLKFIRLGTQFEEGWT